MFNKTPRKDRNRSWIDLSPLAYLPKNTRYFSMKARKNKSLAGTTLGITTKKSKTRALIKISSRPRSLEKVPQTKMKKLTNGTTTSPPPGKRRRTRCSNSTSSIRKRIKSRDRLLGR